VTHSNPVRHGQRLVNHRSEAEDGVGRLEERLDLRHRVTARVGEDGVGALGVDINAGDAPREEVLLLQEGLDGHAQGRWPGFGRLARPSHSHRVAQVNGHGGELIDVHPDGLVAVAKRVGRGASTAAAADPTPSDADAETAVVASSSTAAIRATRLVCTREEDAIVVDLKFPRVHQRPPQRQLVAIPWGRGTRGQIRLSNTCVQRGGRRGGEVGGLDREWQGNVVTQTAFTVGGLGGSG